MKPAAYFLLLVAVLSFGSCEDYKNCNSPVDTFMGIKFFRAAIVEEIDSILPALTFYALEKPDTVLAYRASAREIYVPLNPRSNETQFFIQPDSTLSGGDTLSIQHSNELQFISAGCGFTHLYTLDTVIATYHYIDSIAIKDKEVNTTNATNIKIYY